jgi:CBS domain-containing protein
MRQESIYNIMLSRTGRTLHRLREIDLLQTVSVQELMEPEVATLSAEQTLGDLLERTATLGETEFLVSPKGRPGEVLGVLTLADLERARRSDLPATTPLGELTRNDPPRARPDESAGEALERMARLGVSVMPVIGPHAPNRAVGLVTQTNLVRGYYQALERERTREQTNEELRLRDLTGQEIVEVRVHPASRLAHHTLKDAELPPNCVVVGIRRSGRTVFPKGDTTLEPGDVVVANVETARTQEFRALFQEQT